MSQHAQLTRINDERILRRMAVRRVRVEIEGDRATLRSTAIPRGIGSHLRELVLLERARQLYSLRVQGFRLVETRRLDDPSAHDCFTIRDRLKAVSVPPER